jgi:hypothetical protein
VNTANGGSVDAQGLRDAVSQTLDPLRAHLATVEQAIQTTEADLAELKELRRLVQRTITAADPHAPKAGPKPGSGKGRPEGGYGASEESIAAVRAVLAQHSDEWPDGFKVKDLTGLTGIHSTTVAKVLADLADRGELRLDRVQAGPRGGKFYKVTALAEA